MEVRQTMRTIAMYLPQFHRIKENDEWWGEGFTEWTAVRKTTPQYDGHKQPVCPLNNNYYDLMDKKTVEWQADLAKKYKIDGFAFYHYYFKNGRKILEKPAENLLKWKDIDMPFLFAWDPIQWARSWTNLGNSWADTFEGKLNRNSGVLLEQDFGGKKEWEKHFRYLLPFFKDNRYIKVAGKPVFHCLTTDYIPCFARMISYWRVLAVREGLPGIYVISGENYNEVADSYLNAMAPGKSIVLPDSKYHGLNAYDYDRAWEEYLQNSNLDGVENLYQCVVKFDDSPRRGDHARIFIGSTAEKFKKYFAALRYKSLQNHSKFLFINAWNEWGEGMYLEPDMQAGYAYLEAVRDVSNLTENELKEYVISSNLLEYVNKGLGYQEGFLSHHKEQKKYALVRDWLNAKLYDEAIKKYLHKHSYKNVAIYGFGVYGHMLYKELLADGVNVPFVVDRKLCDLPQNESILIVGIDKQLPKCDLIIISTISDNVEIYERLMQITSEEVITMEELLKYVVADVEN